MIQHAIDSQLAEIARAERGVILGDLPKLKARLQELFKEREEQHKAYLESFKLLGVVTPRPQPPHWFTPMSPDDYLDSHGDIRHYDYAPRP